jgi:FMN phosphatase YigB (HAD superfamily)
MATAIDPSRLKAIVFDVDGTLYRQSGLRRAMMVRLLVHMLLRPWSALATYRALKHYRHAQEALRGAELAPGTQGGLAAAQLRLACERAKLTEAAMAIHVERWMDREPLPLLTRFMDPALRGFLVAARERGIRLGILSDYPAARKLEAMGLSEFFEVVVAAQDAEVNRFKPHPSGLAEALRRLGAAPSEALYVGDRDEIDGEVARALGVACVIVGGSANSPESVGFRPVSDYKEFHTLFFPPSPKTP